MAAMSLLQERIETMAARPGRKCDAILITVAIAQKSAPLTGRFLRYCRPQKKLRNFNAQELYLTLNRPQTVRNASADSTGDVYVHAR
jgi:hypothetical protein